jgi:hypothetical protein
VNDLGVTSQVAAEHMGVPEGPQLLTLGDPTVGQTPGVMYNPALPIPVSLLCLTAGLSPFPPLTPPP